MTDTMTAPVVRNQTKKPAAKKQESKESLAAPSIISPGSSERKWGGRLPQAGKLVHFYQKRGERLECLAARLCSYLPELAGENGAVLGGVWSLNIEFPGGVRHQARVPFSETPSECHWTWPEADEVAELLKDVAELKLEVAKLKELAAAKARPAAGE